MSEVKKKKRAPPPPKKVQQENGSVGEAIRFPTDEKVEKKVKKRAPPPRPLKARQLSDSNQAIKLHGLPDQKALTAAIRKISLKKEIDEKRKESLASRNSNENIADQDTKRTDFDDNVFEETETYTAVKDSDASVNNTNIDGEEFMHGTENVSSSERNVAMKKVIHLDDVMDELKAESPENESILPTGVLGLREELSAAIVEEKAHEIEEESKPEPQNDPKLQKIESQNELASQNEPNQQNVPSQENILDNPNVPIFNDAILNDPILNDPRTQNKSISSTETETETVHANELGEENKLGSQLETITQRVPEIQEQNEVEPQIELEVEQAREIELEAQKEPGPEQQTKSEEQTKLEEQIKLDLEKNRVLQNQPGPKHSAETEPSNESTAEIVFMSEGHQKQKTKLENDVPATISSIQLSEAANKSCDNTTAIYGGNDKTSYIPIKGLEMDTQPINEVSMETITEVYDESDENVISRTKDPAQYIDELELETSLEL